MGETFWAAMFTMVGGAIGGGGLLKFYQTWKASKLKHRQVDQQDHEYIYNCYRQMYEDERRAHEITRKRHQRFEQDFDTLRSQVTELMVENLQLRSKVDQCQTDHS